MGLDQYAYIARKAGQRDEFYESSTWDEAVRDFVSATVTKPLEIAYRRKHPNLQGWMQQLWESRGNVGDFNGDELELTSEDLDQLEHTVTHGELPATSGFFFGESSDDHYRNQDLEFIREARFYLLSGARVFYNSSW
jgi:hypothetical protein